MSDAQQQIVRLEAENDKLRGLLANSEQPCIYCGLPKADLARCVLGFPGCGRADDMMMMEATDAPSSG